MELMENKQNIDIIEEDILTLADGVLDRLLWDHSRPKYTAPDSAQHHHHIYWATDNYENKGEGFGFFDEIQVEAIIGKNKTLLRPRAAKSKEEQERRTKEKAEVFTPSWVCNAQNNLIDEAWFGRKNVFNEEITDNSGNHCWIPTEEKIKFPEGKIWQDYVWANRMEVACGEAPYIVSRYDTTTGEVIDDMNMRIGLLDRKMRVVNENVDTNADWIFWTKCALKSTYGFEWQGDNLLIARESILYSIFDYYKAFKNNHPDKSSHFQLKGDTCQTLAYIISWNFFQMDGINFTLPMSGEKEEESNASLQGDLFSGTKTVEIKSSLQSHKIYAHIAEWQKHGESNRKDIEFRKLIKR